MYTTVPWVFQGALHNCSIHQCTFCDVYDCPLGFPRRVTQLFHTSVYVLLCVRLSPGFSKASYTTVLYISVRFVMYTTVPWVFQGELHNCSIHQCTFCYVYDCLLGFPRRVTQLFHTSVYVLLCVRLSPGLYRPMTSSQTGGVCWLLIVPATCECISGTDLLRQFYVLPH